MASSTNMASSAALMAVIIVLAVHPIWAGEFADLVSVLAVPGDAIDKSGEANGPNTNRLGGFGSDVSYDYTNNKLYLLSDRGPGGGLINYETRFHVGKVNIDSSGNITGGLTLAQTTKFVDADGNSFNGENPTRLTGDGRNQGLSLDPEGFVYHRAAKVFYVSDEYGPSVYAFNTTGYLLRKFTIPDNLIPKLENGTTYYAGDDDPETVTGRQSNRGFEGLALSPDAKKLYGALQDPLQQEGNENGRSSRYVRIVQFDVESGTADKQYLYQLESIDDINARVGADATFEADDQGRSIGLSAILAISDTKFLVLERDNRGLGVDAVVEDSVDDPVGTKRIYLIDISGATDVSNVSLAGTNEVPAGVTPVSKTLWLDIQAELEAQGLPVPEKIEGITLGPQLQDGSFVLLAVTDNDYSVTQDSDTTVQSDVYYGAGQSEVVALNTTPGNSALKLLPSYILSFKTQPEALPTLATWVDFTLYKQPPQTIQNQGETILNVEVQRRGPLNKGVQVTIELIGAGGVKPGQGQQPGTFDGAPVSVAFQPGQTKAQFIVRIFGASPEARKGHIAFTISDAFVGNGVYPGYIFPKSSVEVSFVPTGQPAAPLAGRRLAAHQL